ncbi:MAG: adenylyltransferase/cytidyltransferase family protein [Pseudoxanthomonas sp.]|nr:adenylyltransferase/cytidyltransferase family protein [Pseudoxanthomonas sp.]
MTDSKPTTVITYGTFDIFHAGHLRILERARDLGDRLVVGVSTDQFNAGKGKRSVFSCEERMDIVGSLRCVDAVFPEDVWDQKRSDILRFGASVLVMGADWESKFDELSDIVSVVYLPRTPNISTTDVKKSLRQLEPADIENLKNAVDILSGIVKGIA